MIRGLNGYVRLELKLLFRERMAMALALVLPAANFVLFGFIFPSRTGGTSYAEAYTPSATGLVILTIALFGLMPGLVTQRDAGVFKRLLVTPLDPRAILIATLSRNLFVVIVGVVEMSALGYALFGRDLPEHPVQLLFAIALAAATLFSLAFLLGGVINKPGTAFAIAAILFQPMLFLSGAAMPLNTFPHFVQRIAEFVPMTHAVRVLRLAWGGALFTAPAAASTAVLLGILAGCIFGCVYAFRWTTRGR
jgi:ABC-2 type transport system permease protein